MTFHGIKAVWNFIKEIFTEAKEELYDKIRFVKEQNYRLLKVKKDFIDRLPTQGDYYKEFETIFNKCLK